MANRPKPGVAACRGAAFAALALAVSGFAASATAQQPPSPRRIAPLDPYTEGDADALKKAGYVSLGPFPFGSGHGTKEIEALLGDEPICWIETAHFRVGCAVSPLVLKDNLEWVSRTKDELKRLKVRLPKVKADTKDLDPWLRTHLIAQRCEDLYAEIRGNIGVVDADFPKAPGHDQDGDPRRFYGRGPYFGLPEKFGVLVLTRGASLARYTRAYQGHETQDMRRHFDPGFGCMIFAVAEETTNNLCKDDLALHTHIVYNLAFSLYTSYRYYGHDLPAWLVGGLAHWHGRRISPRFPAYERKIDGEREVRDFWKWDERAPGLLANKAFEPLAQLMARRDITTFGMEQHIESWAFVDFLMTTRKIATMQFLHDMKDPFHQLRREPSQAEFQDRMQTCLVKAFKLDADGLEAAWREYLLPKGRPKK
jgi:hypothetical protein